LFLGEPLSLMLLVSAICVFVGLLVFYYDELKKISVS
jgi:hypothetical protein